MNQLNKSNLHDIFQIKTLSAGPMVLLGIAVVLAAMFNATLVDDDIYTVQGVPAMLEAQGFFHTLQTLFFNSDIRSEYRLFGLSRVVHFLFLLLFGAHAWPYAAVIAVSQIATALGIYRLLCRLDADRLQASAISIIWLLSPFSTTSAFWHYSYFILPYQLTVGCALALQQVLNAGANRLSSWHGTVIVLCLGIAWTGESHLVASVVFMTMVIFATPSSRPIRLRCLDWVTVVMTIGLAIVFHRWVWQSLSGGLHGTLRYVFAMPTYEDFYIRTEAFLHALAAGAETQIVPIVAFAGNWAFVTALAAGLLVYSIWRLWRRGKETENIQLHTWFGFRVSTGLICLSLASLGVLWMLFMFSGWMIPVLYRRYGYIPYTLVIMTAVALLMAPPVRRRLSVFPGIIACGIVIWLWLSLSFVCLPVVRAQDNKVWSMVEAAMIGKRDPGILFVTNWNRPEMPGYEFGGGTPGLRGQAFPEIFESPLPAYWWESEYPISVLGASYSGYQALPEPDGRIRLLGTGLLRPPAVIPGESLIVVFNSSLTPPSWNSDLSQVKVFKTWEEFDMAMKQDLLGSWQTGSETVNLVTDDGANYFATDDKNNRLAVTIQPSKLYIPSLDNEGQVNTKRNWIDWRDGSIWTRTGPAFEHSSKYQAVAGLLGRWYFDKKHCLIEFSDSDSHELSIVNENGDRVSATFQNGTIKVDVWKMQGKLPQDGRVISWSNGSVWSRFKTKEEFDMAMKRDLLGSWQTGSGTVNLVTDDGANYFAVDDRNNRLAVTIQPSTLYIPSLGNEGQVNTKRNWIDWSDGSIWTRTDSAFEHSPRYQAVAGLLGRWYFDKKHCLIEFTDSDSHELSIVNENGASASATLQNGTVKVDVWNIEGKLSQDGSVINWSNGLAWYR